MRVICTKKEKTCQHEVGGTCTIPEDALWREDGCIYRKREQNIYEQAIAKWGEKLQLIVAIEELSELQKAICKYLRGSMINVEEEIADVKIVIRQLEIMFDKVKINGWENAKLKRLEQRIKE